jgi:alpha-glucoside transport system substrate-binding protein
MRNRRLSSLLPLLVIGAMFFASCGGSGGSGTTPTGQVPDTGGTLDAPGSALGTGTVVSPPGGAQTSVPSAAVSPTVGGTIGVTSSPLQTGTPPPAVTSQPSTTPGVGTPIPVGPSGSSGPVEDALKWTPKQVGGTVTVLAVWGGDELNNFRAMIEPFTKQTGIQVQVETTRDLGAVLNTRIQGGNPPDLAGLPNPGQMATLAKQGKLIALDDIVDMAGMKKVYDKGFMDLTTVDGKVYGIFSKAAVKSLIWYDPKVFQKNGFTVPKTWDELKALEDKMAATGAQPWCIGIDGGAGSAWPGTDWIEDFMLRTAGPDKYDQWVQHKIPWTDPTVKNAFTEWGKIVNDPKMVYGGQQTVIATNFGQAFGPMFENPPGCFLHRQASFITTFFTEQYPEVKAGEDYDFFVFPPIDNQYGNPLEVAGDLFGMFKDTPQSRALIQYMVTAQAQGIWAQKGGFLSANKAVDPALYPDKMTQHIGQLLASANSVRFDASDLMPEGVSSAFSTAILQYVQTPDQLDSILQQVESVAKGAYPNTQ